MTTRLFCVLPLTSPRHYGATSAVRGTRRQLDSHPPSSVSLRALPSSPDVVLPPPTTNTARRALTSPARLRRDVVVLEAEGSPLPRQREPATANEAGLLGVLARNDVRDATALAKEKRLAFSLLPITARVRAPETAASGSPRVG